MDTAEEARTVVDKIINYESNPPYIDPASSSPYYTTTTHASNFECCRMNPDGSPLGYDGRDQRSFIESSELVRDRLMELGYTVERVYTMTVDPGGYCVDQRDPCTRQQPYNGNDTPDRYHDGRRLPTDLRSGSGFDWDGDAFDIEAAFTAGRFLVLHRDHGNLESWAHPYYARSWAEDIDNGDLLPFIYSINCSTGYFDWETDREGYHWDVESLMEAFLRNPVGGAVAGIAANRICHTWHNSVLTRGFYDATWPRVVPDFGGSQSTRRLGDILNHGKIYLLTQVGVEQRTGGEIGLGKALAKLIFYHAFGDPTLEMWTSNPHRASLSAEFVPDARDDRMEVRYGVEGATITAWQMLQPKLALQTQQGVVYPVGRARVENGVARISYFRPPLAGVPIELSASFENMVSIQLTMASHLPDLAVSPAGPDLASPGQDIGTLVAVTLRNLGVAPARGTVDGQGVPRAQEGYMVDIVLSSDMEVPRVFAALPLPGGVAFAEDGLLLRGRVSRTPDLLPGSSVVLSAGAAVYGDVGGVIPSQIPPGSYYLCARIDPGEAVAESNEGNNLYCRPIKIGWIDQYPGVP